MELLLDIPMLTNHGNAGRGRPYQTGQGEAVGTRAWGLLVSHTDGFHGNHRWASWPLLPRRQGLEVRHPPDASAHAPSVGGVERIIACAAGSGRRPCGIWGRRGSRPVTARPMWKPSAI